MAGDGQISCRLKTDRVHLLKPTAVNSILSEVRLLQAQGRQLVSLMRGEPDLQHRRTSSKQRTHALKAGRTTYAENRGEPKLREAVADKARAGQRPDCTIPPPRSWSRTGRLSGSTQSS